MRSQIHYMITLCVKNFVKKLSTISGQVAVQIPIDWTMWCYCLLHSCNVKDIIQEEISIFKYHVVNVMFRIVHITSSSSSKYMLLTYASDVATLFSGCRHLITF
jgi:hypothetical protein